MADRGWIRLPALPPPAFGGKEDERREETDDNFSKQ